MLLKTSTLTAPWTIIEGNDKLWARIKTQRTLIEALEATLPEERKPSSKKK
jgi:polyphosphate kinase 2 (PPK2 family)